MVMEESLQSKTVSAVAFSSSLDALVAFSSSESLLSAVRCRFGCEADLQGKMQNMPRPKIKIKENAQVFKAKSRTDFIFPDRK